MLSLPSRETEAAVLLHHDDVARRAFELFCTRSREDGHDLDDWLSAERELLAGARVTTAA